ncbi:MAG: type IV toxin-antitoxin system AbiEi family antitoxin [Methylobacter sp.]|nr:type IV toxin-antitoxin system AbiEi family antitoxin [Methylobacter sp.]
MKEKDIVVLDSAISALTLATGIVIGVERHEYRQENLNFDATGSLYVDGEQIPLVIEVKFRPTPTILMLSKLKDIPGRLLIVADYVNPKLAERLKEQDIWFLDTVGNAYINQKPVFVFIRGNKPTEKPVIRTLGRAFQPTGLKIIYTFLCNPELVNAPYREIARTAGVALGTVGWVMTDLNELGHLVDMGNRGRRLKDKQRLLERWIIAYSEKLRPKLQTGRYKAPNPSWWQTAALHNLQAYWGGEVAADKLTHYLKPEIITLYVMEKWAAKLKITNQLRKDPDGDVEILNAFWDVESEKNRKDIVNPILIYADLMATGDPRNIETAQIIYEQKLAQHFREDQRADNQSL